MFSRLRIFIWPLFRTRRLDTLPSLHILFILARMDLWRGGRVSHVYACGRIRTPDLCVVGWLVHNQLCNSSNIEPVQVRISHTQVIPINFSIRVQNARRSRPRACAKTMPNPGALHHEKLPKLLNKTISDNFLLFRFTKYYYILTIKLCKGVSINNIDILKTKNGFYTNGNKRLTLQERFTNKQKKNKV